MTDRKIESIHLPRAPAVDSGGAKDAPAMTPDCFSKSMERLVQSFETSARRWELVVYPSLFAFIILAAYGFFLIYSLSTDMSRVAHSVEYLADNMNTVTQNMVQVSGNLANVSHNMASVTTEMTKVADKMETMEPMSANIATMNRNIGTMTQSVQIMTASMDQVRRDMSVMNHSISRPMGAMNSFMPW